MTDNVNAATKPKEEEEGGKYENEICTAVWRSLISSQKQRDRYKLFLKMMSVVLKKKM
jgi:hypothetical protein